MRKGSPRTPPASACLLLNPSTLRFLVPLFGLSLSAHAAALTAGNVLVYRVGSGSAALGTTATAVFLDEYTPSGALVQSISAASTGASSLTAVGNATTEGILTSSANGSIYLTGYRKDAGGTNPSSDAPATTKRVVGQLGLDGVLDTSVAITDSTSTIRSATFAGTGVYIGTATGVRFADTPSASSTSVVIDTRNSRQVTAIGSQLFASNGSTAITAKLQSYGSSLPTGTTSPASVISLSLADAINGFFFADLSPSVAGVDTVYALSTVTATLIKYTFDGTLWSSSGSVSAPNMLNVSGFVTGSSVGLFATSTSVLSTLTDTSGYGGTLTGSLTTLATAGTNTGFRGVAYIAAIPEPSAWAAVLGATVLGFAASRRRRR